MFATITLAAAAGIWLLVRTVLAVLPSLPRDNSDFLFV